MSSRRLSGKVLRSIAGRPLLQYVVERIEQCHIPKTIVVATSTEADDTPICTFCMEQGLNCIRGSLNNVADRFRQTIDQYGFEAFVRISADSPVIDPKIVERAVAIYEANNYDLVTNIAPRTFPHGQSVEVVKTIAFQHALTLMETDEDFEHVTRVFYKQPNSFRISNFVSERDYGEIYMSVDRAHDLHTFEAVVRCMSRPHWDFGLDEMAELYSSFDNVKLNKHVA